MHSCGWTVFRVAYQMPSVRQDPLSSGTSWTSVSANPRSSSLNECRKSNNGEEAISQLCFVHG